ncbi:MAG TPA: transposase, partial [Nitrososphaerales archaeon]|nr:transposase [Nitrososphaerales archaeon]
LDTVALSTGEVTPNPKFLKDSALIIERPQRDLSRKMEGSQNRKKAKLSLAKAWRKVRRQRGDFAHKLSHKLASENNMIEFESPKINPVVKNHNLESAILDSSWGKFRQLTVYKAERRAD